MEQTYWTYCEVCDLETTVIVDNSEDDKPSFCPMCGSDVEFYEEE